MHMNELSLVDSRSVDYRLQTPFLSNGMFTWREGARLIEISITQLVD